MKHNTTINSFLIFFTKPTSLLPVASVKITDAFFIIIIVNPKQYLFLITPIYSDINMKICYTIVMKNIKND